MDCCVCSSVVVGSIAYRPPRNTICAGCLEGARSILSISSKIEQNSKLEDGKIVPESLLLQAARRIEHLELMEKNASRKFRFLQSLEVGFREGIHTDVELVARDGRSIRAHRIVLATKSSFFKVVFEADACKSEHSGAIVIPELDHGQLEQFVQYLYSAEIAIEDLAKNAAALLVAADKYDVADLARTCEAHLVGAATSSNALEMIELADLCSAENLKQSAVKLAVDDYQRILFSKEFEEFAMRSAMAALELTRAVVRQLSKP